MKRIKNDLQAVSKSLKQLGKKTEQIAKRLDKVEKAKSVAKPRAKARVTKARPTKKAGAKKPARATAGAVVLNHIEKSRKGTDGAMLQKKTGFNSQKIRDNIYKLMKRGKIKRTGRGVYIAA